MAALDFPASPTNGQVYGNWIWSSDKNAWKAKPLTPGQAQPSATPPANPSNGDQWYNTIDGVLYIYYNDGNSSQWVESRSAITSDGYYSPNYIINGAFDIWQRGTSFTNPGAVFTCDRFKSQTGSNAYSITQVSSSLPNGFRYGVQQQATGSNSFMALGTQIEYANFANTLGGSVTFSFYAKALNSNAGSTLITIRVRSSSTIDAAVFGSGTTLTTQSFNISTSWARYSFTIPAATWTGLGAVSFEYECGSVVSGDGFQTTGWQLEEGAVATPFRRNANSLQGELAACMRYYWRGEIYGGGAIGGGTSNVPIVAFMYPVEMRITPSMAWVSGGTAMDGSVDIAIASLNSARSQTTHGTELLFNSVSNFSGNTHGCTVRGAIMQFSAEL